MVNKIELSIVVPAYNEANRIGPFLKNILDFSMANLENYEIIIVNDGSTDNTEDVIKKLINGRNDVQLIRYSPNKGKGEAVKAGIFNSSGEKIIFIDADGSIQPDLIPNTTEKLDEYDVVAGDRSLKESKIKNTVTRWFTGKLFNIIVGILFQSKIRDNLCGFKGFRKDVAIDLFSNLITRRWLFDVEIFYRIKQKNYILYQMPIKWEHVEDSKLTFLDPFKMFCELFILRVKLMKQ